MLPIKHNNNIGFQHQNSIGRTQASVDELLLEVLEHLPQTVRDLEGGMTSCSAVLEPETILSTRKGTIGPLGVALQRRQQMDTYCTVPLVLDFMSRKFTKGLPSLRDTEGVLENKAELSNPGQTLYGKYREAGPWKISHVVLERARRRLHCWGKDRGLAMSLVL